MGVSRISTGYMIDRGLFNLHNSQQILADLQQKVSTSRNISNPSDDPVGLTKLLRTELESTRDQRFLENIESGRAELSAAETAIAAIVENAHRARELAVQASNGSNTQAQLDAIAMEVQGIIDQLVQLGNTKFNNKYIFSGFETQDPAFVLDPLPPPIGVRFNGTTPGDPYERQIEIADGSFVSLNVLGDDLLGDVLETGAAPPASPTAGYGLLEVLTRLKLDLQAGDANAMERIRTTIDDIVTEQDSILQIQADVGARINRLDLTKNRLESRKALFSQEVARIQDIDLPGTISDLNFQQTIFQASLGVMGRVLQTSLVNFIS